MASDELQNVQRWTAKRRMALVLSIIKGETSTQEAARKHGLRVAEVEEWKEKALLSAENSLRSKPKDGLGTSTSTATTISTRSSPAGTSTGCT